MVQQNMSNNVVHFDRVLGLTIREVAEIFAVDERTIRRWCADDPVRARPALPRRPDGLFDVMIVVLWATAFRVPVGRAQPDGEQ
jgi:hypothetical protein